MLSVDAWLAPTGKVHAAIQLQGSTRRAGDTRAKAVDMLEAQCVYWGVHTATTCGDAANGGPECTLRLAWLPCLWRRKHQQIHTRSQ